MADKANVLKEFLIRLGFNVDPAGVKNFISATGRVTKVALATGTAVTGAAAAMEAYVQVFAAGMEKLYYSSKRAKDSVENIEALEYGTRQIGISADTARESLEAMAAAMRVNPGMRALLNNIVGHDTSAQGTTRSMVEMVQALNARYPHFVGARMAGMFGMDEKTFFMMSREAPKLLAAEEKYHQMAKRAGVDTEKAAAASVEYMNALRGIWAQVTLLGQALAIALLPKMQEFVGWLGPVIEKFTMWIGKNRELLASRLDDFLRGIVGWLKQVDFDRVFKQLDEGVKGVDRFVTAMGGWKNVAIAVVAIMSGPLLLAITNFGIAIAGIMANPAVLAFAALIGSMALLYKAFNYSGNNPEPVTEEDRRRQTVAGKIARGANALMGGGDTPDGAPGSMLLRDAYNRLGELSRDSWNSPDQSPDTVKKRNDEMSRLFRAVAPQGGTVSFGAGTMPAGGAVTIHQKTEITVNGAADPGEVARGVIGEQKGVNASLVRDFSSKVN